jgi:hypothetical protein
MKYWRKMAKKDENGKSDGREIKSMMQWSEQMGKTAKKSTSLLDALFARMGMRYVLSAKQTDALKTIKERNGENTNEVK